MRGPGIPVIGPVDHNPPVYQTVQTWGPDKQSMRMALWNWLRGSSFGPQSWGPGVRQAPSGASESENVKTDAWFSEQQRFAGAAARITDPAFLNVKATASYPAGSDQIGPAWLSYMGQLNTGLTSGMFQDGAMG